MSTLIPSNGGRATDQYLVPGIPGSSPATSIRSAVPTWPRPASWPPASTPHAALYIVSGEPQSLEIARIVQTDLAAIGITIDITALPGAEFYTRLTKPGEPWDLAWTNWGADFADPFTMINELYDPAVGVFNPGHFNDPALTRRMRQAATLTGDRRLHAYARLDEDMTRDDPPAAAWGIGTFREFFSARVGCQIYQPIYGIDLTEASAFDTEPDHVGLSHTSRRDASADVVPSGSAPPTAERLPDAQPGPTRRTSRGRWTRKQTSGLSRSPKSAARVRVNAKSVAAAPSPLGCLDETAALGVKRQCALAPKAAAREPARRSHVAPTLRMQIGDGARDCASPASGEKRVPGPDPRATAFIVRLPRVARSRWRRRSALPAPAPNDPNASRRHRPSGG